MPQRKIRIASKFNCALCCICLVSLFSTQGCSSAKMITIDGHADVYEAFYLEAAEKVKTRAAFELGCTKDKMKVVVLATHTRAYSYVSQLGVEGCGKKIVYVNAGSYFEHDWVANTSSEAE